MVFITVTEIKLGQKLVPRVVHIIGVMELTVFFLKGSWRCLSFGLEKS